MSKQPWTPDAYTVEPAEGKTRFHDLDLRMRYCGDSGSGFDVLSDQAESLRFVEGRTWSAKRRRARVKRRPDQFD